MKSCFNFLKDTYPELYTISELSEKLVDIDPSSSLTKSRLLAEKIVKLIWEFEELESTESIQTQRIDRLYQQNIITEIIRDILHTIRRSGNRATHEGGSTKEESLFILKKAFKLVKWFYETYENTNLGDITYLKPENYDKNEINELNKKLIILSQQLVDYQEKINSLNKTDKIKNDRRKRSATLANQINLDEHDTRIMLIDPQLRNAGWECDTDTLNYDKHKTMPVKGRNIAIAEWSCGSRRADYALFVGTTLYGIVEAKRYAKDISTDLHQSKIYAQNIVQNCDIGLLGNWEGYKVPFLFSTNGREYLEQLETKSGVWFLDIRNPRNASRALQSWYSPQGLVTLFNRNLEELNKKLQESEYDYLTDKNGLSLRYYQMDAIKAVEDKIVNNENDKRALLVMATGTGKTRTAVGLAYRLIKVNRFKRILFITDRRILAKQAFDGFKDNKIEKQNSFYDIYKIDGLKEALPDSETRLHFATVQSMIKRLFYTDGERLAIDTYDCIIVDEAHRGYNLDREISDENDLSFRDQNDYVSQYKRVINYFDAHIIGLTATPALHTTQIFGMPVHSYSYREAVIDGYLVDHEPPYIIKTRQSQDGILWQKGEKPKAYDPETNQIEELAELEDELHIEIDQFNKKVITPSFNKTVINELVKHIDPEGEEKTLIFAVRDSHADMIVNMLSEAFKEQGIDVPQEAIKKITGNTYDPEELTRLFRNEKYPNIVVTVDLLTTGVDIPQISNIVFMRRVNSRILFEQMMGRATRLCPEIGKEFFRIFDAVRVYEALEGFTQMGTVSNPSYTFKQLVNEFEHIKESDRKEKQIQQIITKLQRRCRLIQGESLDQFMRLSGGDSPHDFIVKVRSLECNIAVDKLQNLTELWEYLDERVYHKPQKQLLSEHEDELIGTERGYGDAEKPEDYINSFKEFILQNRNKILAINTICSKPGDLDRKSLKELKLILDQNGFSEVSLNTAWRTAKNQDIAADIIAYIRTLALDISLVPPEERVKNAIQKVKNMHQSWTKAQLGWIDRFGKQLLAEAVLTKEDLDKPPFTEGGGYSRLNKVFNNEIDEILHTINENLYTA